MTTSKSSSEAPPVVDDIDRWWQAIHQCNKLKHDIKTALAWANDPANSVLAKGDDTWLGIGRYDASRVPPKDQHFLRKVHAAGIVIRRYPHLHKFAPPPLTPQLVSTALERAIVFDNWTDAFEHLVADATALTIDAHRHVVPNRFSHATHVEGWRVQWGDLPTTGKHAQLIPTENVLPTVLERYELVPSAVRQGDRETCLVIFMPTHITWKDFNTACKEAWNLWNRLPADNQSEEHEPWRQELARRRAAVPGVDKGYKRLVDLYNAWGPDEAPSDQPQDRKPRGYDSELLDQARDWFKVEDASADITFDAAPSITVDEAHPQQAGRWSISATSMQRTLSPLMKRTAQKTGKH